MPSFKTAAAVLATGLFSISVSSQAIYSIDPESVPEATRESWCNAQTSTCPLLCLQLSGESATTEDNSCQAADLTYSCICGNGLTPNLTEYSQTLPYFLCTQFGTQCVANCNGDSTCQSACRSDHPCGAQNPTKVNLTTATSSATTAGATKAPNGVVYSGLGGSSASPTDSASSDSQKSGAEVALGLGNSYGLAVVVASVFAGFAMVL